MGEHAVVEMERGGTDYQILERDDVAKGSLLAFDLAGKAGDLDGEWLYSNITKNFLHKVGPVAALPVALGPIDSMSEFNDRYRTQS